jgi:hypothetical protein
MYGCGYEEKSAGLVMRPSGEKVKKTEVKKVREKGKDSHTALPS